MGKSIAARIASKIGPEKAPLSEAIAQAEVNRQLALEVARIQRGTSAQRAAAVNSSRKRARRNNEGQA